MTLHYNHGPRTDETVPTNDDQKKGRPLEKEYLGDGVYIEVENGMFKVTTENGIEATNTIFFEPEVYEALVRYAKKTFDAAKQSSEEP